MFNASSLSGAEMQKVCVVGGDLEEEEAVRGKGGGLGAGALHVGKGECEAWPSPLLGVGSPVPGAPLEAARRGLAGKRHCWELRFLRPSPARRILHSVSCSGLTGEPPAFQPLGRIPSLSFSATPPLPSTALFPFVSFALEQTHARRAQLPLDTTPGANTVAVAVLRSRIPNKTLQNVHKAPSTFP